MNTNILLLYVTITTMSRTIFLHRRKMSRYDIIRTTQQPTTNYTTKLLL